MLPFVLPWIRRQKVEWLMDAYVGLRARYPEAEFSYVGHSNGTYLVARALEDYPGACFRDVLFAGSVVRRDFNWDRYFTAQRVSKVLNIVATKDWVVALFPMGLEPLRKILDFDLGGAGFGGFDQAAPRRVPKIPNLDEVRYVEGAHSAGLVETQWQHIANFIVKDVVPSPNDLEYPIAIEQSSDRTVPLLGSRFQVLDVASWPAGRSRPRDINLHPLPCLYRRNDGYESDYAHTVGAALSFGTKIDRHATIVGLRIGRPKD
ncbi:MAG: hypothetical protein ACR2KT_12195 [Methylocella sp.]|nr:MAG: hypothetical protein DLM68_02260 [Hyphomicrobiales bacterium]